MKIRVQQVFSQLPSLSLSLFFLFPPVYGMKKRAELARPCEVQHTCSRVLKDPARAKCLRSNSHAIDLTGTNCVVFMNKSKSGQRLQGRFGGPQTQSSYGAVCFHVPKAILHVAAAGVSREATPGSR